MNAEWNAAQTAEGAGRRRQDAANKTPLEVEGAGRHRQEWMPTQSETPHKAEGAGRRRQEWMPIKMKRRSKRKALDAVGKNECWTNECGSKQKALDAVGDERRLNAADDQQRAVKRLKTYGGQTI